MHSSKITKHQSLRHRQILVDPKFTDSIQNLNIFSENEQEYITEWIFKKKAFVGRSLTECDLSDSKLIPVGLMAYISYKEKKRLNLLVKKSSILKIIEPLLLREVLDFLPEKKLGEVEDFLYSFNGYPVTFRVYGSLFWSYQDKKNHFNERSDLDLLIQFNKFFDPEDLSQQLFKYSESMSIRLDGEFEILGGASVSWREFASNSEKLLVKTDFGPRLQHRDEIMEQFRARCY
jgi:malonate decarboxylase holo-[acyl-carrier-protein] synthase